MATKTAEEVREIHESFRFYQALLSAKPASERLRDAAALLDGGAGGELSRHAKIELIAMTLRRLESVAAELFASLTLLGDQEEGTLVSSA